jgi:hypothetical protein
MPPRFAYWTILIDNAPTAFRARDPNELLPTLTQLKRTNPDVVMKWFARGQLWESPRAERDAQRMPKTFERRGKDWRPGGQHQDPRARFDPKKRKEREAASAGGFGAADRKGRPWRDKPQGARPWRDKSPHAKPWRDKPAHARPWQGKPPQTKAGSAQAFTPARPGAAQPFRPAKPHGRKPWTGKPPGASRQHAKPWRDQPRNANRKPVDARDKPFRRKRRDDEEPSS